MDVVILAGGKCDPALRESTGAEFRADIVVNGKTLAQTVLEATQPLGEPILVGGPSGLSSKRVEAGANFCDSLANGLKEVKTPKLLLVTVDLPRLTTEGLKDFIGRCNEDAGLNFPIVSKLDCENAFPGMKRTTLKLREGTFTGGNVAVMDTHMMRSALPVMERAYALRKKPLKLAGIVGYVTLLRVVLGQAIPATLPLRALEAAVGRFLGVSVHGVVSRYPELGADLDKVSDYEAFNSSPRDPKEAQFRPEN